MKSNIFLFIVFQVVVWWLYFQWDGVKIKEDTTTQKVYQVSEVNDPRLVSDGIAESREYQLILRDDGFFTKIDKDETIETGTWEINYDIPSIIFKSPTNEFRYRILVSNQESLQIELINVHEIIQARLDEKGTSEGSLFSTTSVN